MDYTHMYAVLCSACSAAIDMLDAGRPAEARALLQDALLRAEEFYMENAPDA